MCVLVNDFLTNPVYLRRKVRRGDARFPMLYILCVEVLAFVIRASPQIEGFLFPGAAGVQFKVGHSADDTTAFVKDEKSLFNLFAVFSMYERAKLSKGKTEAMWLGQCSNRIDELLGLAWVNKIKLLFVFFGVLTLNVMISKLEKSLALWKSPALSMIGRVFILNILRISKLRFASRVLEPPRWVYARVNSLIWPFLRGASIEKVARKLIICSTADGCVGFKHFRLLGQASRFTALASILEDRCCKAFFILKYFCGCQLATLRPECRDLIMVQ